MYLSRLDLHGFKSFARKTAVEFAPGVTAIVGPNGCGKSNVIDAVRWVLGEQRARTLRSDSMAGVIFNGAEGTRALGLAEVSLTVQNNRGVLPTEYGEVTVTRRLYRSGDSEYLLNGTACRLRDVLDLFMDTGLGAGAYSVIELSMVEDILSDNADDRRRLFEEAAGVTKYKRRRAQALRRLDATQADLTRVDDIVEEVDKQVRALQRQAQKAARHARLAERLRRLELGLAAHDHAALQAERDAKAAAARGLRDRADGLQTELTSGEAELETARAALADRETERAERQRRLAAHTDELRQLDAALAVRAERRDADGRALDRLQRDADADDARRAALDAETETLAARRAALARAAEQSAEALAVAEAARTAAAAEAGRRRDALDAARRALAEAEATARQAAAAQDRAADRAAARQAETARLDAARDALRARDEPADAADLEHAAQAARAELDAAAAALDAARRAETDARAGAEAAADALADARAARDAAAAQAELLDSLAETGEGAAAFLAAQPDWRAPTVAEVVACDEADAAALDAALGLWAAAFVVQTDADADDAIARLRAEGAGRGAFVVLDRLGEAPRPQPTPPGARPVLDVVRADARYRPLLARVLGDAFLVDDLAAARALGDAHPAARFVTPAGAATDAAGFVQGGSAARSAQRLGAAERQREARAALGRAEAGLAGAQATLDARRAARDAAAETARAAEAARDAARSADETARAALARSAALAGAQADELARLDARAAELAAPDPDAPDADALAARLADAARGQAEALAARDAAAAAFEAAEQDRARAEAAWADARLAQARDQAERDAAERDARRAADARDDLAARAARRAAEREAIEARRAADDGDAAATRGARDAARQDTDALRARADDAETAVLQARAAIADAEAALRTTRAARETATRDLAALDLRLAEIATRQETILERLADEHDAALDDAADALDRLQAEELFQPDTARAEAPALRQKLRALGPVNALALESYDQETERLGFLQAQRQDLADAETALLDTIDAINTTARARFDETFAEVQGHFARLFAELFGDTATASLALDGDDPLEAPVSITARPKGKKPVSLAQLSGGEKTLTATALLFAIYLVKPSPFCILDEVDAPLDDANVERFMRLIRSFADSTQFILVTHNKLTMEAADRMYGVTMPTPGVSRLVGVDLGPAGDGEVRAASVAPSEKGS